MSSSPLSPRSDWSTFVDVLRARTELQPEAAAYVFLADGESCEARLTYAQADLRARAVAAFLQRHLPIGGRAMLVMPSGLEYVTGFFGCMYAGAVAVTAHTPRLHGALAQRDLSRLEAIAADCQPQVVLTSEAFLREVRAARDDLAGLRKLPWKAVDAIPDALAPRWRNPATAGRDTAFLQYTSGSTAAPKGVVVSHANLIHNQRVMQQGFCHDETTRIVSWLPLFHDMGLIGQMLHACWLGGVDVFMSPQAFVARPARWLEAISRYAGTSSLAPNFGYDLCVRKVNEAERVGLDLRSWRVAGNASEPVRAATLARFAEAFGPCGFHTAAAAPAYGLAEGTLIVTAGRSGGQRGPHVLRCSSAALNERRIVPAVSGEPCQELVGSGRAVWDELLIVDPETGQPAAAGMCGEVWLRGGSVALGYWQRSDETATAFSAELADGTGPFLRTGDLGCLFQGELFVAGRIKDLIIVQGQNYYPQDIEQTVDGCHAIIRPGCGAAFAIDADDREQLVIVQEAAADTTPQELAAAIAAIRQALATQHALEASAVVLLPPQTIWKTTSGKTQRKKCRQEFLHGRLPAVAHWQSMAVERKLAETAAQAQQPTTDQEIDPAESATEHLAAQHELETRLRKLLIAVLGAAAETLERDQGFTQAGLDSAAAVDLATRLSIERGLEVPPTWLFDYPTLAALAQQLAAVQVPVRPPATSGAADRTAPNNGTTDADAIPSSDRVLAPDPAAPIASDIHHGNDIAIIGMACRFPGADDVEEFWRNLTHGVNSVADIPPTRFHPDELAATEDERRTGPIRRWAGLLERLDEFDAEFFGISPHEARWIDPQHRLLLELCWTALESAGRAGDDLAGSATGVFLGLSQSEYQSRALEQGVVPDGFLASGNYLSMAPNRVSYCLNLKGPSLAVDTACSSSLVAVHLALQSLRSGECTLAIAGGANALLEPRQFINFAQAGMLAADGRCKSFDERADGYVRGEGAGVVVLKPLARALADGDRVVAVIKSSAVNQDGHTAGLTAPSGPAQTALVEQAWATAGMDPISVGYLEAHGTGTALGDPIELAALERAFAAQPTRRQRCAIGSVKTNIGHLEAAAGVAGLIKVCLSLNHRQLPPSLNLEEPNRLINFDQSPFYVVDRLRPWSVVDGPRCAGVSAFGFGGANAHVVVEEFSPAPSSSAATNRSTDLPAALILSARNENALAALAQHYATHLSTATDAAWRDVCFTAAVGRAALSRRLAVVADNSLQAAELLTAWLSEGSAPGVRQGVIPRGTDPAAAVLPSATAQAEREWLETAADAWVGGAAVNWATYYGSNGRRVLLPTYPFQRQSYWLLDAPRPRTIVAEEPALPGADCAPPARQADSGETAGDSPASFARAWVKRQVAAILEIAPEAIDLDANFHELGLDSVLAMRVGRQMTEALGEEIEPVLLYTFPTVRRLADCLCDEHAAAIQAAMVQPPPAAGDGATVHVPIESPQPAELPRASVPIDSVLAAEVRGIAIIGLACRFPGATNVQDFWEVLRDGRSTVGEIPADRRPWFDRLLSQQGELTEAQREVACRGGFLDGVAEFDAALFGISPAEARVMDPQQRLFLETAWQAVESAGYAPAELARQRAGVFVGATTGDYARYLDRAGAQRLPHFGPGNVPTMIANRVSYRFDWHGPSMTLDTACSSSLVAVHAACQSLLAGEADVALAGGVNLALLPDNTLAYAEAGMISPCGQCRSFDDGADGYVRGEGAAAVLLKPLAAALRDGDTVWAVIEGAAVNQDGHDKLGLTAPNPVAQAAVLRQAYAAAGVEPETVTMLEAHGSGTPLGDPLEIRGLREVFGARPAGNAPCALGSVKSNLGHLEAAAGIAGLLKAVLALVHRQLLPTVNYQTPNRHLTLTNTPFFICDQLQPWIIDGRRRAGVSSFGAGGTNAHVVLAEAPARLHDPPAELRRTPQLLVLSAQSQASLDAMRTNLAAVLQGDPARDLCDVCWTAAVGRTALACRLAVVFYDAKALADSLDAVDGEEHGPTQVEFRVSPSPALAGAALQQHWHTAIEPRLATLNPPLAASVRGSCSGAKFDEQIRPSLSAEQRTAEPVSLACLDDETLRNLYLAAAEIFVAGIELDFTKLLSPGRRVSLPTYPFERQRYWIDLPEPVGGTTAPVIEASASASEFAESAPAAPVAPMPALPPHFPARVSPLDDHLRQVCWRRSEFVLAPPERLEGQWLLFARPEPWCEALTAEFKRRGAGVTLVQASDAFRHPDLDRYLIRVVEPDDFVRLRENLQREGRLPTRVVFAWSAAPPQASSAARQAIADSALRSLLYLLPVCAANEPQAAHSLHVLTRGSQALDAAVGCASPEQATVWGWLRSAALEFPELPMQCVDLPVDDAALGGELWRQLLGEMSADKLAPEAALAPGGRWTSELAALDSGAWPAQPAPLRREGVYLITGGLGGLGWSLVGRLLTRYHARVAVLSRRALPPRESWPQWLNDHADDPWAAHIRQAQVWLAGGGELISLAGDVANEGDVGQALAAVEANFGRLHGVFHAAGVLGDGLLRTKDWKTTRAVLRPKLAGAWALDAALADRPLDFLLLFSSLAGVLGNVGQADYAAANRFLDSFAAWRNARGKRTLAVAFGPWSDVGMAAGAPLPAADGTLQNLDVATGVQLIERALESPDAHLAAAYWKPALRPETAAPVSARDLTPDIDAPPAIAAMLPTNSALAISPPASIEEIQALLLDRVSRALETAPERIDVDRPLLEMGIDSVLAVRLSQELGHDTGHSFPRTLFYDFPTLRKLAAALAQRFGIVPPTESPAVAPRSETSVNEPPPLAEYAVVAPASPLVTIHAAVSPSGAWDEQPAASSADVDQPASAVTPPPNVAPTRAPANLPIAVIGLGGRFPMADSLAQFWRNLCAGASAIREIPPQRWSTAEHYSADRRDATKSYSRWAGLLSGLDQFDPLFFRIAPREAEEMDPQQRLLLEVAWEALETAGYAAGQLSGTHTGVFIGAMPSEYLQNLLARPEGLQAYAGTGTALSTIANRLSYYLNLRGPCLSIDTACSSSLVAVHLAVEAIRSGQCEYALAGGTQAGLALSHFLMLSRLGALSPDGLCRAFDRGANGYVLGEGVGLLVLKRLDRALADGDHLWGVIRGAAVNHGGQAAGLTVPSFSAQAEVIRAALDDAGVSADTLRYIEAHGTGTALGDPIEIQGLCEAFRSDTGRKQFCAIGSLKSNIGHLEPAAGVAGMIKTLLALEHRQLPPTLHVREVNPGLELEDTPFFVQDQLSAWRNDAGPLRAGVSSFGFGGVNAHVVLEEPPPIAAIAASEDRSCHLALLSARSPSALAVLSRRLLDHLIDEPGQPLADVCYSLAVGRPQHAVRLAAVVESHEELISRLRQAADGAEDPNTLRQDSPPRGAARVAWLLGGARHVRTGALQDLHDAQPTFRRRLQACAAAVDAELETPLLKLLYETAAGQPLPPAAVRPAAFALQWSLGKLWEAWGAAAEWVAGDGLGEAVAACLAGAAPMESMLPMIARQGRLLAAASAATAAVTVQGDVAAVRAQMALFSGYLGVAETVARELCTVAGPADVTPRFARHLAAAGFVVGPVQQPFDAAHTPAAEALGDRLEALWRGIEFAPLKSPLVSSLAGQTLPGGHTFSTGYWREQMRDTSQLSAVYQTLPDLGCDRVLDLRLKGDGTATGQESPEYISALGADGANWPPLLLAAARLSLAGASLDLAALDRDYPRRRVPLPTYPFERQRYWVDAPATAAQTAPVTAAPLETPAPPPTNSAAVGAIVRQVLAEVLHVPSDKLDGAGSFQDLGVDSLMAEDAAVRLGDRLGLPALLPAVLFEHPSIDRLTQFLTAKLSPVELESAAATGEAAPRPQPADKHDVAIIGYFGQFPQAADPRQLWELLARGRCAVGPMPEERWQLAKAYDPELAAGLGDERPVGGFLTDIDQFDPAFFRLTAAEANQMDPRQRLFLTSAYRAVEHAGYAQRLEETRTGVFVGCGAEDYVTGLPSEVITEHTAIGGTSATLPSRLAYLLNLRGPCLAVDTACSSALVALHLAVHSLRRGECDLAVAGGVHLHLRLTSYMALRQMGALAGDGVCRPFGEQASGFVPGEGAGAVLLRPLADALAAGDRVYGIIRGTAMNNDGRTNGLAAPNPAAQRDLLAAAWHDASVSPSEISYIEAHGTGTALGDPMEAQALTAAMQEYGTGAALCGIGSIKSNLGHADAAAGMASLMKVLLALEHESLPASLHAQTLNPRLHLDDSPLRVVRSATAWPRSDRPRLAGVSAFGFSGTNVHVVIAEPPIAPLLDGPPPAPFRLQRCWLPGWDKIAQARAPHLPLSPEAWGTPQPTAEVKSVGSVELKRSRSAPLRPPLPPGEGWSEGASATGSPSGVFQSVSNYVDSNAPEESPGEGASATSAARSAPRVQQVVWQPLEAPLQRAAHDALTVVFHTDAAWQLQLVDALRAGSAELVQVLAAKGFHRYDAGRFTLAPLDRAGYDRILAEVAGGPPRSIRLVHLWSCGRPLDETWWAQHVDEKLTVGVRSVLTLAAALSAATTAHRWELRLVTAGAQNVLDSADDSQPLDAATWGLCRAATSELAHVHIQAIDAPVANGTLALNGDDFAALSAALAASPAPAEIAIRNGQVWTPRFAPLALDHDRAESTPAGPAIKPGGVYLITGGLGAIGQRLADWLIEQGHAAGRDDDSSTPRLTLVLVGRTALPPVEEWQSRLAAADDNDPMTARIRAVERWQAQGAVVHLAVADVSNVHQTAALATHVRKRFGHVDGVFHLAGMGGQSSLREMTPGQFAAVLQTKLVGAWALDRALADGPPDWFVSFSSLAGWIGNPLQSHYSAASRFLDAFAAWQTAHGRRGLSVAWGLWRGLGMAATETARQRGDAALDPAEAFEILRQAILAGPSHVLVSAEANAHRVPISTDAVTTPQEVAADYVPMPPKIDDWPALIRQVLVETLESPLPEVDPRRSFLDYGVDSLLALKFARLMSARLGRPLPATLLFDFPNVETLAEHFRGPATDGAVAATSERQQELAAAPVIGATAAEAFRLSSGRLARRLHRAGP